MRWTARRERFRSVLTGDDCVHPASVFDPMSACIAENLGFEAGMLAGSVASMTVLGAPDMILLTLSEFAGQALRISRASGLPLLVDADHGYGNALNVRRTVEELEIAGVAALSIEDTDLPQPYGAGGGSSLVSIDEGVGKMRAALEGRVDAGLVIAGRLASWGEQFQDPRFIVAVTVLMTLVALNLFGVFEVLLPGSMTCFLFYQDRNFERWIKIF